MEYRGPRYTIVTGKATLPVTIMFAVPAWLAGSEKAPDKILWWGGLAVTIVIAGFLLEFSNRNSLLRIRSYMIPSVFLVMAASMTFAQTLTWNWLPPACFLLAYYSAFLSYQNYRSQGYSFHTFAFLGIGALVFPQMLYFAPLFLFFMLVQLRSMSAKSFVASLLGLSIPIVLRETYFLLNGTTTKIDSFWLALQTFAPTDYTILDEHRMVSAAFVIIISAVAMIHFMRTKFNDKIRTRMFFYVIMLNEIALMSFIALQPQHFDVLFRLLVVNSSILIAHHLTFARNIVADIYFYVLFALFCFLAFYNFTGYSFGIWPL